MNKQKRIGIITFHRAQNFGAALQAYALQEKIESIKKKEYTVQFVDYTPDSIKKRYSLLKFDSRNVTKSIFKLIFSIIFLYSIIKKRILFNRFVNDYLILGKPTIEDYDILVCGSDQIWNPLITNGVEPFYYAESKNNEIKRISYAASFAITEIPIEYREEIRKKLLKFDYLSLREIDGVELLKKCFSINSSTVVLDPCFFLTKEQWSNISVEKTQKKGYVLVYQLIHNEKMINDAKNYAQNKSCEIIELSIGYGKNLLRIRKNYSVIVDVGPLDFIGLIKDACCVFTNSFHGTAFSLIFEKQFFSYPFGNRSSRLLSLLDQLDLKDRFITNQSCNYSENVDYEYVTKRLDYLKGSSNKFLIDAIHCCQGLIDKEYNV